MAHVVSAADSSLGSIGTMEKEWFDADSNEVTSRDGRKGVAPMELFFSDFRSLLAATTSETNARLNLCERVATVSIPPESAIVIVLVALRCMGRLPRNWPRFRPCLLI
jgi:hypothetical protein